MADQLLRRHAGEAGDLPRRLLRDDLCGLFGRLLRARGAGAEQQSGGEDQTTHRATMPAWRARGKVAAAPMRR